MVLALVLSHAGAAQADRPRIDIDGANFQPLPLALVDLKNVGKTEGKEGRRARKLGRRLSKILRSDVAISSLFTLLDPRSFIADQRKEGLTLATINCADWVNVGAEALVKGSFKLQDKMLYLEFRLFEVTPCKEAFHKKYSGPAANPRKLIHRFANELVRYYTNEPGIFLTRICFEKQLLDNKDIWVMDFDGHNEIRITSHGDLDKFPAWSPDAKLLAFTSFRRGNPDLYLYSVIHKKVRLISSRPGLNMGAAFSPDGKKIAFTLSREGNSDIYVMNIDGSGLKRLTDDWAIDASPTWSPDGKQIAFVSERSRDPGHIYIMNADGGNQRRLTYKGRYNQEPEWSPRGDWIVFTARDELNFYDIFKVSPVTGEIVRLTQDEGKRNEHPTWAPNGRHVAFSSNREGEYKIFIMNGDGSNQRKVSMKRGEYMAPTWSPRPSPSDK